MAAARPWAGWWRGLQKAAGRDIFVATADETQLEWCWYEGAGSISIHQPHVFRLFLDLNSNQFPAVGLFKSHVTFGQWASHPGPFPRLDNVRKAWLAWTEKNYLSNFSWCGGLWCLPRTCHKSIPPRTAPQVLVWFGCSTTTRAHRGGTEPPRSPHRSGQAAIRELHQLSL